MTADTLATLPADGEYELLVGGTQPGSYRFQIDDVNPTALTLGTPFAGTLTAGGFAQLFRVPVANTQALSIVLDALARISARPNSGRTTPSSGRSTPTPRPRPQASAPQTSSPPTACSPIALTLRTTRRPPPPQRVDVSDKLDWNTFQFTEVAFGDQFLAMPSGSQFFHKVVDVSSGGTDFQVATDLDFNSATGQITAQFQAIDPATGLPFTGVAGFLPPEDGTGRGQAHFRYTVHAAAGLATGTEIRNVATIQFDFGEIIDTNQVNPHDPATGTDPQKEALVTIDGGPPSSGMGPLLAVINSTTFVVSWSGTDDAGGHPGSGIASYDVFVSDNGGAFTSFRTRTTQTSASFTGQVGHTYAFYSVATDNVGNRLSAVGLPGMSLAGFRSSGQGTNPLAEPDQRGSAFTYLFTNGFQENNEPRKLLQSKEFARSCFSSAERAGFEPAVRVTVHGISSAAPSASRSPLRKPSATPTIPPAPAERRVPWLAHDYLLRTG